jgi:hypothetical protein
MLSVDKCRTLLGDCRLSDSELETLRNELYCLAHAAVRSLELNPAHHRGILPSAQPMPIRDYPVING